MTDNQLSIAMELASDRAHERILRDKELGMFNSKIFEDEYATITVYTDEAQDLFNEYYDEYLSLLTDFFETL